MFNKSFLSTFILTITIINCLTITNCFMSTQKYFEQKYFEFPKPTGKHAIGTKLIEITDTTRNDPETNKPRKLMVQVWFPADKINDPVTENQLTGLQKSTFQSALDKPQTSYAYEITSELKRMCENACKEFSVPKDLCNQLDLIRTYAITDAKIIENNSKYPVIIFAHGYGTARGEYTALCEEIASHGYIVLMVMHSYLTSITRFLDGTESHSLRNKTPNIFEECYADIEFMLDKVQNNAFGEITQFCDFENIGIVGHSLGGIMSTQVCKNDTRVKAGISLDGPLYGPEATVPFHKPFMFIIASTFYEMFGDKEGLEMSKMTEDEFANSIDNFCKQNNEDSYKLTLKNSEHCTFTDSAVLVNIFKDIFHEDDIDLCAGKIDGIKATEIIRAHVVSFFDKYLKNQTSILLDTHNKNYDDYLEFKSWI